MGYPPVAPGSRVVILAGVTLSRPASLFLLAVGVWNWVIWPTFLRNIWADDRSFDRGPTAFLLVHAVLVAVSLVIGTAIGVLGWRGLRAARRDQAADRVPADPSTAL
jgi:hypothetical protein